jgi:hypothetical protein
MEVRRHVRQAAWWSTPRTVVRVMAFNVARRVL